MKKKKNLLKEYLKNIKTAGTVRKSSKVLCKKILSKINFNKTLKICELGPGEGVITRFLLDSMDTNSSLVSFEVNSFFCEIIKKSILDKRFKLIESSAEYLVENYPENEKVDVIVSSIPFAILPKKLKENVLINCSKIMDENSIYIQYHYSPFHVNDYKKYFKEIKVEIVPINLPPAFVYVCKL